MLVLDDWMSRTTTGSRENQRKACSQVWSGARVPHENKINGGRFDKAKKKKNASFVFSFLLLPVFTYFTPLSVEPNHFTFTLSMLFIPLNFHQNQTQHKGEDIKIEHSTFILYQINKHFVCTLAKAIVLEFSSFVSLIAFGRPLTIQNLFLSLLYHSLFSMLEKLKLGQRFNALGGPFMILVILDHLILLKVQCSYY